MDIEAIQREIEDGFIHQQLHPTAPLRILNYSQKSQFDWRWNAETTLCRGLIVDDEWKIVARPFPKFFSVEQLGGVVPREPFEVFEKLDGSLGILYRVDGEPRIASRGSFVGPQAVRATEILHRKYAHVPLDDSMTYLFEIIYPENRVIVDYGATEDLILLAVIETDTGIEHPLRDIGFPTVRKYDGVRDFDELMAMEAPNREGFVVRFESGQRVKLKFEEYKRLHKILAGVNTQHVWEALRAADSVNPLVERVPDEFHDWVRETENTLRTEFVKIEFEARREMRFSGSRKELAAYFKQCQHSSLMFTMLDGGDYRDQIWRMIKPSATPRPRYGDTDT